jgi:hypothetical protein
VDETTVAHEQERRLVRVDDRSPGVIEHFAELVGRSPG